MTIDEENHTLTMHADSGDVVLPLYSDEAFELISAAYLKVGWNQKYVYTHSWLGRPIIQLPDDMFRIQEVIWNLKPDVIVETGVAHGGSLIFYSTLCRAIGKGRVIGIDIEIRPHNRKAIMEHGLFDSITLVEGSSIEPSIVQEVREHISPDESVLVILDSNHSYDHVAGELAVYSGVVSPGSYIVVTDGSMKDLTDVPRGRSEWSEDNPHRALLDFLEINTNFELVQPVWPFNESTLTKNVTLWPSAYLRRIS